MTAAFSRRGSAALWYALLGGASAWFTALCVAYFLVTPACAAGSELAVHLVHAAAFLAAVGAVLTGAILWRQGIRRSGSGGRRDDRTHFLAGLATSLSSLFTLVLVAQWLGAIVHQPCRPAPRLPDSPDALVEPLPQSTVMRDTPPLRTQTTLLPVPLRI